MRQLPFRVAYSVAVVTNLIVKRLLTELFPCDVILLSSLLVLEFFFGKVLCCKFLSTGTSFILTDRAYRDLRRSSTNYIVFAAAFSSYPGHDGRPTYIAAHFVNRCSSTAMLGPISWPGSISTEPECRTAPDSGSGTRSRSTGTALYGNLTKPHVPW